MENTENNNEIVLTNGAAKHLDGLLKELSKGVQPGLTKAEVEEICLDLVAAACIPVEHKIILETKGQEIKIESRQHYLMPVVAKLLSCSGLNLILSGPAGSGKTQVLLNLASTLGTGYILQPFHAHLSKAELLGYMDANGHYVASSFRRAFEEGCLYIADEFDCANPSLATVINSAIANRVLTFPDNKTISAHEDFKFCACMNTRGLGANSEYVGRNRLDAATLDRFVVLHFPYDSALEASFLGLEEKVQEIDIEAAQFENLNQVYEYIQFARAKFKEFGWNQIISPRASIFAKKLCEAGFGKLWITELVLARGLNDVQRKELLEAMGV